MNGAWIGAVGVVAAALLALAGAVYTTRTGGRQSPYDRLEGRVLTLENQHDADVEQRDTDRHLIEQLLTRIAGLDRRIVAVIADRDDVVAYLITERAWVNAGRPPPPPRIPQHLRDVIPTWSPEDADRSLDVLVGIDPDQGSDVYAADPGDTVGP